MPVALTWLAEAMRVRVRAQSLAAMRSRVYRAVTWRTTSSRINNSTSCSLGSSSTPSGAQGISHNKRDCWDAECQKRVIMQGAAQDCMYLTLGGRTRTECMDRWMDGWMDRWMDGCMDG